MHAHVQSVRGVYLSNEVYMSTVFIFGDISIYSIHDKVFNLTVNRLIHTFRVTITRNDYMVDRKND